METERLVFCLLFLLVTRLQQPISSCSYLPTIPGSFTWTPNKWNLCLYKSNWQAYYLISSWSKGAAVVARKGVWIKLACLTSLGHHCRHRDLFKTLLVTSLTNYGPGAFGWLLTTRRHHDVTQPQAERRGYRVDYRTLEWFEYCAISLEMHALIRV